MSHSFPTRRASDLVRWILYCRRDHCAFMVDACQPHRQASRADARFRGICVLHAADAVDAPGQPVVLWFGSHLGWCNGLRGRHAPALDDRSEEHTSELQSLMRISYAVFCLKKKKKQKH